MPFIVKFETSARIRFFITHRKQNDPSGSRSELNQFESVKLNDKNVKKDTVGTGTKII